MVRSKRALNCATINHCLLAERVSCSYDKVQKTAAHAPHSVFIVSVMSLRQKMEELPVVTDRNRNWQQYIAPEGMWQKSLLQ